MPVVKKVSKKSIKPSKLKLKKAKAVANVSEVVTPMPSKMAKPPRLNSKLLGLILVLIVVTLIAYKYGPWLVPAIVDKKPVTRLSIWRKLESSYGKQTLDDIVNEMILDKAIAKTGVKVDQATIDAQISIIGKQFESVGGLDEALKQRGLTKADIEKQVRTQLSVEEILQDKISISEEEIKQDFDDNATTLYQDKELTDVSEQITAKLKDAKLRDAFVIWFAEAKKSITVKNFGL